MYIHLFSVALYILLKESILRVPLVEIDVEYPGHDAAIKEHLLNLLRRSGIYVPSDRIGFRRIGKKSSAHDLAIAVYRGESDADHEVIKGELMAEFGQ